MSSQLHECLTCRILLHTRAQCAHHRPSLLCSCSPVNILHLQHGPQRKTIVTPDLDLSTDLQLTMTPQDALVALMIAMSASDADINTAELVKITSAINMLPIFAEYDADRLSMVSQVVFDLLEPEDGLDALFGLLRDTLPERLYETAYALACEVAAANGSLAEEQLRLLEEIRYELNIDRLHAAAIERGARARHVTL